jgi:hypothetical protein
LASGGGGAPAPAPRDSNSLDLSENSLQKESAHWTAAA